MAAKTNYLGDAILNAILRNSGTVPSPATVYVALNTSASSPTTPGTECTDANYTRQSVTFGAPTATFAHSSSSPSFFGAGAATGATIVEVALYDAASGGNELLYTAVSPSVVVAAGDTANIASGNLTYAENGAEAQTLAQGLINAIVRNIAFVNPTAVYGALNTTTSPGSTPGTEVSDTTYARKALTFSAAASGSAATSGVTSYFGSGAASGPHTIVEFAIYNALSGGSELFYGNLTSSKTVNAGDTLFFAAGALSVAES